MLPRTRITRRSLLASISVATATNFVSTPAPAAHSVVDVLWQQRTTLINARRQIAANIATAMQRLPTWAAPGPLFRNRDGVCSGGTVDHPEIRSASIWPQNEQFLLVRPNVGFYKNQHERHRSGGRAADLELSYNLTRLEKRIADQRLEWDKVGLPALRTDLDLLRREIQVLEERLRSFPPVDKNVAAVKIMLEMCEAKKVGDLAAKRGSGDASLAFLALQAIEDELYGSVKDDVRLLLHHKEIPLKDMSWWI